MFLYRVDQIRGFFIHSSFRGIPVPLFVSIHQPVMAKGNKTWHGQTFLFLSLGTDENQTSFLHPKLVFLNRFLRTNTASEMLEQLRKGILQESYH